MIDKMNEIHPFNSNILLVAKKPYKEIKGDVQ